MKKHSFCFVRLLSVAIVISFILPLYGQALASENTKQQTPVNKHRTITSNEPHQTTQNQQNTSEQLEEFWVPVKGFKGLPHQKDTDSTTKKTEKQYDKNFWGRLLEDPTAIVSMGLVLATCLLACFSLWQASLFRKELILTQRPRLRVSNVITKNFPELFGADEPIRGQLYITNIGGMPSKIINIGCWIEVLEGGLPMERPYEGQNPKPPTSMSINLIPGQSFAYRFVSEVTNKSKMCDLIRGGSSDYIMYIMGYVQYVDDIGTPRRTSFCRKFGLPGEREGEDRRASRFFAVKDPDYEYEE